MCICNISTLEAKKKLGKCVVCTACALELLVIHLYLVVHFATLLEGSKDKLIIKMNINKKDIASNRYD